LFNTTDTTPRSFSLPIALDKTNVGFSFGYPPDNPKYGTLTYSFENKVAMSIRRA
jgi:hypothetical protein